MSLRILMEISYQLVKFASYLLNDPLVGVKIEVQLGVVLLDDHTGGLLDRLGSNTSHDGGESYKI